MKWYVKKYVVKSILAVIMVTVFPHISLAQIITTTPEFAIAQIATTASDFSNDANNPSSHVLLSPLLESGSFVEGSTFQVPIVLNTEGESVYGIEVRINFDKDKLAIAHESNGISIIGVWTEPPQYDNTKGTASYMGVIPQGINTEQGVIGVITFVALHRGNAVVTISDTSRILLNDGLKTKATLDRKRGEYVIIPKVFPGVYVFSPTHPDSNKWYNNNSPVISWDPSFASEGFSYVLDNNPSTVPKSEIQTKETSVSFEKKKDGLWYFHVKEKKNNGWGAISHFLIKIDTVPPEPFIPKINSQSASSVLSEWIPVSFFTIDSLSGIDHYEVGMTDKAQSQTASPSFVQAESPFLVPIHGGSQLSVSIRAIDKAGNVRDATVRVEKSNAFLIFKQENFEKIVFGSILVILVGLILLYFFRHHIFTLFHRALSVFEKEKRFKETLEEIVEHQQEAKARGMKHTGISETDKEISDEERQYQSIVANEGRTLEECRSPDVVQSNLFKKE